MFFTCEVHKLRFSTLQELKQHDIDHHSVSCIASKGTNSKCKLKDNENLSATKTISKNPSNERQILDSDSSRTGAAGISNKSINGNHEAQIQMVTVSRLLPLQNNDQPIDIRINPTRNKNVLQCHICLKVLEGGTTISLISHLKVHFLNNDLGGDKDDLKIEPKSPKSDDHVKGDETGTTIMNTNGTNSSYNVKLISTHSQSKKNLSGLVVAEESRHSRVDESLDLDNLDRRPQRELKFPCSLCDRSFKSHHLRQNHVNTEHYDLDFCTGDTDTDNGGSDCSEEDSVSNSDSSSSYSDSSYNNTDSGYFENANDCSSSSKQSRTRKFVHVSEGVKTDQDQQFDDEGSKAQDVETPPEYQTNQNCKPALPELYRQCTKRVVSVQRQRNKNYLCYFCGFSPIIQEVHRFESHIRKHTLERPHRCKTCNKAFMNQAQVDSHEMNNHDKYDCKKRKHKCKLCGSSFKEVTILKRHMLTHSTVQSHRCPICNKGCKRSADLRRHLQTVHGNDKNKQFSCKICDRKWGRKDVYQLHMKEHHPTVNWDVDKPRSQKSMALHVCRKCNFQSTYSLPFYKHLIKNHPSLAPFTCTLCINGNKLKCAKDFKEHIDKYHADGSTRIYPCVHCKGLFIDRQMSIEHLTQIHGC